jgi:hypothetical protein
MILADALRGHALHDVCAVDHLSHGVYYVLEGPLATPGSRHPWVRSVWIVPHGRDLPRLVTACPCGRRREA